MDSILFAVSFNNNLRHNKYANLINENYSSLFLHSADYIPKTFQTNEKFYCEVDKYYKIDFKQKIEKLLPSPYETNCHDYEGENGRNKFECSEKCLLQLQREKCGNIHKRFFVKDHLIERDKKGKCNQKVLDEIDKNCQTKCLTKKYQCINNYYEFSMSDNDIKFNNNLYIEISPKSVPIEIMTHSPAMTFEEYIANVGGLMGVYLGTGLIAIYDYLIAILKYLWTRNRFSFSTNFITKLETKLFQESKI